MPICFILPWFFLCIFSFPARSQTNIPIASWRLHLSYNNIRFVEVSPSKVFAATESGILVFATDEKRLYTYNKLDGLSSTGISAVCYDPERNLLLTGYEDGNLDLISSVTTTRFSRLKNAEVTTPKRLNHISVHGNFAYLSTAYGVVVFDLDKFEIRETWRDLGASGEALPVYQSAFLNDSIYLATANGVIAGKLTDNLLDYNMWDRFTSAPVSEPVQCITTFNDKVYAAGSSLYHRDTSGWKEDPFPGAGSAGFLSASAQHLFLIADSSIWSMNATGEFSKIEDPLITAPTAIKEDAEGNYWIGDHSKGLLSNRSGSFSAYLPNGPSVATASRMVSYNGKIFVLPGGFLPGGEPLNNPGELNVFENGLWRTVPQAINDLTDIAFANGYTFLSSFGSGLARSDVNGDRVVLDETNSPLRTGDGQRSNIPAMENSAEGLWVANYGGDQPLHLLKDDAISESFSFGFPNEQSPVALSVDGEGDVWMVLDPATGGGLLVLDRASNTMAYKTNSEGSGALPDMKVRSIATDRNGYTWVGTDAGVAYFYSSADDAIKPIYENRFLLRDEKITAIEVDPGNRKWIGTEQGAWLFNATGETLIHHFTPEDSPLLSGVIRDIEINDETGEVFFATDRGIVSYRGDATAATKTSGDLKIFPNPVYPGYNGTVGIAGLSENAYVTITSISGKLIARTRANGGTATWNVRDQEGRRVSTGVYLIFAASEDGTESVVGKIAVIE